MCVSCLLPSQEVSTLELTVQMTNPNGARPQEVLLILSVNKNIHLTLQVPEIPLHLAYVSVLLSTPASGTDGGRPLRVTSAGPGLLLLSFILTFVTRALPAASHGALEREPQG